MGEKLEAAVGARQADAAAATEVEESLNAALLKEQHRAVARRATLVKVQNAAEALEREKEGLERDLANAEAVGKRTKKEYVALQVEQEHLWSKLSAAREEGRVLAGEVKALTVRNATLERELKLANDSLVSANAKRGEMDDVLQSSLGSIRSLQNALAQEKRRVAQVKAEYAKQVGNIPQAYYSPARSRVGYAKTLSEQSSSSSSSSKKLIPAVSAWT